MKRKKYFKKDLSYYEIVRIKNLEGKIESWAKQLSHEEVQLVMYSDKYKLVKEELLEFKGFLINPDLDDEGYPDPIDDLEDSDQDKDANTNSSKLKEMLNNLKTPPIDFYPKNTLGQAANILGLLRDRHQTVEMPPQVIINPKHYSNSSELETAIREMRERHGTNASILVSTTPIIPADDYLATLKNKETIGLTSYPDKTKPLGVTLDPEIIEIIKMLKPKK